MQLLGREKDLKDGIMDGVNEKCIIDVAYNKRGSLNLRAWLACSRVAFAARG